MTVLRLEYRWCSLWLDVGVAYYLAPDFDTNFYEEVNYRSAWFSLCSMGVVISCFSAVLGMLMNGRGVFICALGVFIARYLSDLLVIEYYKSDIVPGIPVRKCIRGEKLI